MKLLRFSALLVASALLVTACKREAEITVDNPLLAYVPADTPYVYANLEATPRDVIDAFLLRAGPSLEAAQALLDNLKIEINTVEAGDLREAKLASAIMAEFNGKLNRAGLESMGLSLESQAAIYGMGVFPVMRVSLKDADALRETIARIERASGVPFTTHVLDGQEYWRVSDDNQVAGAYFAILDDHFAFSLFPVSAEDELLPALLGKTMPANSTAAQDLIALNKARGYTGFGSGYVDLQRLADEFFDAHSRTAALLAELGHGEAAGLDEVCKAEIRGMIAKAPRIVAGTTELSANRIGISYQLELEPGLAEQLSDLVADVPVADSSDDKVFSAALGLNVVHLRDFLRAQFTAIAESPYQCRRLEKLNLQADAMLAQLNQPMPPFINNFKGFRVSLDEFDPANFNPETARGMFSLEMDKPQMVIGMAQMMIPGMAGLELEPGADPVPLPQELLSFSNGDLQVYAAMGEDSIGIALGASTQSELARFMDAGDAFDQDRFAGPVVAHQRGHLTGRHVKIDTGEGLDCSEVFFYAPHLKQRCGGRRF